LDIVGTPFGQKHSMPACVEALDFRSMSLPGRDGFIRFNAPRAARDRDGAMIVDSVNCFP
jgi:hypothetical protein